MLSRLCSSCLGDSSSSRCLNRNLEGKGCPFANFGIDCNSAAHHFHKLVSDGEPQATAAFSGNVV